MTNAFRYNKFMKINYPKLIGALLIGAYLGNAAINARDWHFIDGANLIFHEAGHWLFAIGPEWWTVAGGSIFQVALPLVLAVVAFLRRDYFTSAIIMIWVGQSLVNVSVYAGDALKMELDLIGGENTTHDWNHLLWHFGALRHTDLIAGIIRGFGVVAILAGFVGAVRLSIEKPPPRPSP